MASNTAVYPLHQLMNHLTGTSAQLRALVGQTARQLRQLSCGVSGHDTLMHFDGPRVSLVCVSCGYESPGWSLAIGRPSPGRRETRGTTSRAA